MFRTLFFTFALALVTGAAVNAKEPDLAPFFGEYAGQSLTTDKDDWVQKRDMNVVISRYKKNGFTVQWTTATYKPDGRVKRKEYTLNFQPSSRAGIYEAAARANLFGGFEPLDPMQGDPYAWATVVGRTITVHVLLINEEGSFEMQVYERTLTDEGMDLHFSRVHDGPPPLPDVHGKLVRQ